MKYQLIFRKLAISLIMTTIIPLIWANKSKTQTLAEKSNRVFINENFSLSKLSSKNSSTLTTQQLRSSLNTQSPSFVLAQVSGGAVVTIIFVFILIGGIAVVVVIWRTTLKIQPDEVGIVYKKFAFNPSLRFLPEQIIAFNGEPGLQAKVLLPGVHWGYFSLMYEIKKDKVTTISQNEIGLVEARYGKSLEKGQNFGRKVDCDNFQNAQTFLEKGGQAGKQLVYLEAGTYYINTEIFNVKKVPIISIRPGEIGLVIANYGALMPVEQIFGKVVECNDFQDAEAFLNSGGQKGKQLAILRAGTYQINTDLFTVITTDNAHEYNEYPENLKICKIDKGKIGIVTTMTGKTLPKDEIAGLEIEGHNNYQDGQKFLDLEGYKGLQEEVLKEGGWNLNPWFVKVEQVPVTRIEQEEVGVVVSFVGKKYDKDDDNQSQSSNDSQFAHQLVPEGYRGVQKEPLMAGDYAINTRVKTVQLVPITQIILNWSDEDKHPLNYDYELKKMKLTSFDGYETFLQFTQMIHIAPENAPKMISMVGAYTRENKISFTYDSGQVAHKYPAIKNLVSRVLTKVVSGYFRQAATGKTAIAFQEGITSCQKEAEKYINERFAEIGVEGTGTYINAVDLPQELDEYRQRLEKQKQEAKEAEEESRTIQKLIDTAKVRQKLVEEEQKAEAIAERTRKLMDAQTNLEIEKAKAEIEQLRLDTYQKRLDIEASQHERIILIEINALKEKIAILSPEIYAQIETQEKWAEPATKNSLSPQQKQKNLPANSAELKIPVVLVLDTSSSMSGERIDSLNAGIAAFKKEFEPNSKISQSVELAIITSNSNRREIQDFVSIDEFFLPPLKAEGETMIGKGINLALREIENYQNNYQSNNIQHCQKPWLFYIIGIPPTDNNWQKSAERAWESAKANKLNFFVVTVKGVEMINLTEITSSQTQPKSLNGFPELFHWIAENIKKSFQE